MKKLKVETKNKSYEIVIKEGILSEIENYLPKDKKLFLITNDNLDGKFKNFTSKFENKVVIKDGEEYKNFQTFQYIIEELLRQKIERKDVVIAFGGGVTGDLAGYAAASVLRGVGFIQIPTTLLAEVDSSVGGKTGFNTKYGKNLVGAFYQPDIVLIDTDILSFLPEKQIKTGLGEVIKYAFIEKNCTDNQNFYIFDYLKNIEANITDYKEIIYKSCGLKAAVVSTDEKEKGLRAVLNFGHTFAHAIETITNYKKYTHGEAVSIGMKYAFKLSLNLKLITEEYYKEAISLIDKFNLAPDIDFEFNIDNFISIMKSDKKVVNSKIRLVLPTQRGEVKIFDDIEESEIKKVLIG